MTFFNQVVARQARWFFSQTCLMDLLMNNLKKAILSFVKKFMDYEAVLIINWIVENFINNRFRSLDQISSSKNLNEN